MQSVKKLESRHVKRSEKGWTVCRLFRVFVHTGITRRAGGKSRIPCRC